MILNSRFSNFLFNFPKGWIYPEIAEKYQTFFDRLPIPYRDATDFINYSVQSISWPAIEIDTPTQVTTKTRRDVMGGNIQNQPSDRTFKSGFDMALSAPKDFTVTFKTTEGFLNYWIMAEQLEQYISYSKQDQPFLPSVQLQILDHYGYLVMTRVYQNIIFKSISELDLSYSTNLPEYRTFSCGFMHNGFILKKELQ